MTLMRLSERFGWKKTVCDLFRLNLPVEKITMETRTQALPQTKRAKLVITGQTRQAESFSNQKIESKNHQDYRPEANDQAPVKNEKIAPEGIAERAYNLWAADGRQNGRDLEYWLRAEAELKS
jgi:hypothetical protein